VIECGVVLLERELEDSQTPSLRYDDWRSLPKSEVVPEAALPALRAPKLSRYSSEPGSRGRGKLDCWIVCTSDDCAVVILNKTKSLAARYVFAQCSNDSPGVLLVLVKRVLCFVGETWTQARLNSDVQSVAAGAGRSASLLPGSSCLHSPPLFIIDRSDDELRYDL